MSKEREYMSEEKFVYTACPGWGDHDYCALKTIVKDGKIERMERVIYSDPEEPDGLICQKGCLTCRMPYDPARVQYPMKRAGERGEGKWERISWDQALGEIADKLKQIAEESGPDKVVLWDFPAGIPASAGVRQGMINRFFHLYGPTSPLGSVGLDNGPFYTELYLVNTSIPHIMIDPRNIIGADLVYVWGCNPVENQMRMAQNLVRAREAGARLVDVGLVFDGTAGLSDEFIAVKAASDGHLAMAMVDYILQNDLQDNDYLIFKTNAAYMVREDTGMLAQDANGNYLVFDNVTNELKAVAPAYGDLPSNDLALFGSFEWNAIKLTPVLQKLKDHARQFSIEKVADRVGLPASKIEQMAYDYTHTENVYIVAGYGMRYYNANETYRLLNLLGVLTGRLGKPKNGVIEALQIGGYPMAFNLDAISYPMGQFVTNEVDMRAHEWFAIAEREDSPYRGFICTSGNPVHQQPDRNRWLRIFKNMDLIVDIDIWMTDTGELADYVLPELMSFERKDIIATAWYNHVILQEPAIEPQVDAIDFCELFTRLGKLMGYGEYFDKTLDEWLDIFLDTDYPPIASVQPKITLERLEKEKMVRANFPAEPKFDPWSFFGDKQATATGRMEIYADRLTEVDRALATPIEPKRIGKSKEYPYQFFSGRQRFFMQSSFTDDPINIEMSGGEPATRLNPKDARELGLEDGEMVEVYNENGHVVTKLDIDESVQAGLVHVWFGWRARQFKEGTYAEVTSQFAGPESVGPVEDKWWKDHIDVFHFGNPNIMFTSSEAGSTDMYWDSWCNIRKYEEKTED